MSAGLLASFLDCLESLPPRGTGNVHAVVANKEVAVSPVSPSPSVGETEKDQQNQGCLTCLTCLTENQPEPEQKQDVTPASPKVDAEPSEHNLINEWRSAIAAVRSDRPEIEKLKTASLRFLASPDATAAVENGWDAVSLFGMHEGTAPKERIDCWGLVLFLAWGVHGCTVETVDQKVCALRTRSGAVQTLRRNRANFDEAIPWWKHPGITNAIDGDSNE